jgi:hypothetical protein
MDEVRITDLPVAVSIDPIADTFPIVDDALDDTQQINRNVFLGITGNPVGTSDVQSIGNKTIGVSNTVSLLDNLFTLQDNSDPTKMAQFQLSGISVSTTRTYTLPNASSTLADISTAQTFTNKTLTSPAITGGSISNSTISVDSISEFTAANGVTIDGLNIKDAKLNTVNSVVTSNITDSAVTPAKLQSGTGSSWVWQSWVPTFTNWSIGTGGSAGTSAHYIQIGKTVFFVLTSTLGSSGQSVGSSPTFTLPVTTTANYTGGTPIGQMRMVAAGGGFFGYVRQNSTTTAALISLLASGTYVSDGGVTSTTPATWAANDSIQISGSYEGV